MMEMEEERLRMREHIMKNVSQPWFFTVLPSLLRFGSRCFLFCV